MVDLMMTGSVSNSMRPRPSTTSVGTSTRSVGTSTTTTFAKKSHKTKKSKKSKAKKAAKALCSKLEWYKRWFNTIKGWFGSKPTNCTQDKKKLPIFLATGTVTTSAKAKLQKLCSKLEWYKRWWNTFKGWFGSKPSNCRKGYVFLATKKLVACSKLEWYKSWWNTIKGWFGSKVTNCFDDKKKITVTNKNEAALYLWLTENPVDYKNYKEENPLEDLMENNIPEKSFFKKYAEVFRNEGLRMEDYKKPVADNLLKKIPSFVDEEPVNAAVYFLDVFERAKSTILANDITDKQFLNYIEKFIMTWAIEEQAKEQMSKVYEAHADLTRDGI